MAIKKKESFFAASLIKTIPYLGGGRFPPPQHRPGRLHEREPRHPRHTQEQGRQMIIPGQRQYFRSKI